MRTSRPAQAALAVTHGVSSASGELPMISGRKCFVDEDWHDRNKVSHHTARTSRSAWYRILKEVDVRPQSELVLSVARVAIAVSLGILIGVQRVAHDFWQKNACRRRLLVVSGDIQRLLHAHRIQVVVNNVCVQFIY